MADTQKEASLRKRNQIAKSNQMMFVWVACASVLIGFSVVISIFLFRQIMFNERVLAEKGKTVTTLQNNIANIPELEAQVRVLDSNSALMSIKARESDRTVQVILDALPSTANPLALGASLQNKLLVGIPDISVESLEFDSVAQEEGDIAGDSSNGTVSGQISFQMSIKGTATGLRSVLQNLERSIRTIDIVSATIEGQKSETILTIRGRGFYEPARVVELKDKVVK